MPAFKVKIKFSQGDDEKLHMKQKIKLPSKWVDGNVAPVKKLFVDSYNSKHPGSELNAGNFHLETPTGSKISDDDVVKDAITSGDTLELKPGKAPRSLKSRRAARKEDAKAAAAEAAPTTAAGVRNAVDSFNYSKWDKLCKRMDLSDDDDKDVHPNIDKASWKRLMGRQRDERREGGF